MTQKINELHERSSATEQIKYLTGYRKLLPLYLLNSKDGMKIQIFPVKLAVWILTLSVSAYLGGGLALYLNDRINNDLNNISVLDRLYPPYWERYSQARGDSYVENAVKGLENGNFSQAFHQIRVGLARSPANLKGRTLLADMFVAAGRNDLAETTLLDGMEFHAAESDYLEKTLAFLFRLKRDEKVITLANGLLPDASSDETNRSGLNRAEELLASSLATAYIYRGNFDQAEEVLSQFGLATSRDGRYLLATIEWERGYKDLALVLIEQLAKEFPADPNLYRSLVGWQLEHSLSDTARRTSLLRRLAFPQHYQPRVDLLYSYEASGDDSSLEKEVSQFVRDFGASSQAMLVLGDFAANTGRPAIAQIVFSHAKESEIPLQGPALMLVESEIVAGNYESAVVRTRALIESYPEWESQFAPVFNGLRAIANYALGDRESASLYLDSFLNLKTVRADNLVAVAKRLKSVGAKAEARRVLAHAVKSDPLNQTALAQLIEFDLSEPDSPDLGDNLRKLMKMRRPSPGLMQMAYNRLGHDRFMFIEDRNILLDDIASKLRGQSG